ncbi:unnamed protein product, partial [Brassica oleracea]
NSLPPFIGISKCSFHEYLDRIGKGFNLSFRVHLVSSSSLSLPHILNTIKVRLKKKLLLKSYCSFHNFVGFM